MRRRRGSIIALCYIVTAFLMAYGTALLARSMTDQQAAFRHRDQLHAFQMAEAGVDDALIDLRNDFNAASVPTTSLDTNQTYAAVITQDGSVRTIRSTGTSSDYTTASKQVEAKVEKSIPENFYDNALYGSDDIKLNGNSYSVTGDVLTGSEDCLSNNFKNVTGDVTYDPGANPLPKLSFAQLQSLAAGQGNMYDQARLDDIKNGQDSFPSVFCYSALSDPNDPSSCTPNINYVTADLVLNGNVGTIGGFFVVAGNVLTDPSATQNTTVNGNGQIEGMVYTTGEFTVNGGGGGLNVSGGVWAGGDVTVNGNVTVEYNPDYMKAVEDLDISADLRMLYWKGCPPTGCT